VVSYSAYFNYKSQTWARKEEIINTELFQETVAVLTYTNHVVMSETEETKSEALNRHD
jgi:hypothetical protein